MCITFPFGKMMMMSLLSRATTTTTTNAESRNKASWRRLRVRGALGSLMMFSSSSLSSRVDAFAPSLHTARTHRRIQHVKGVVFMRPPPGSGYLGVDDEESTLPDTYEPMMEYPGTMRPGKTPENMPFQDLPIGDDDPDPVPWPHFQEIEWHHQWEPPHEHPIPMEQFIEMHGRWATPEMEASMRAGVRRSVRDQQAQEAASNDGKDMVITDDDEDEDDSDISDIQDDPVSLGDGIFGKLGSDADRLETAAAVSPNRPEKQIVDDDTDDVGEDDDTALDDFLLDLGLDADPEEEDVGGVDTTTKAAASKKDAAQEVEVDLDMELGLGDDDDDDEEEEVQMVSSNSGTTATINVDDDDDGVGFLDDDDDLESGVDTVPLDDFGDDSETLDTEDIFDEGGFDFDDGGDFGDGGDSW